MTFPFHQKKKQPCVEQATAKYDAAKNGEVLLNWALTVWRAAPPRKLLNPFSGKPSSTHPGSHRHHSSTYNSILPFSTPASQRKLNQTQSVSVFFQINLVYKRYFLAKYQVIQGMSNHFPLGKPWRTGRCYEAPICWERHGLFECPVAGLPAKVAKSYILFDTAKGHLYRTVLWWIYTWRRRNQIWCKRISILIQTDTVYINKTILRKTLRLVCGLAI